ncbi:MAG: hypothetical protein IJK60_08565 [Clostridia bacterium]|nr:hypothetical protein [Clostridia bacterium]
MKRVVCILISLIMLCGIAEPTFAEENSEPVEQKAELIGAEIIYLPIKNRFVFKEGNTEYPDGILLKLTYSDNTEVIEEIKENGYEYYAGNEKVVFFTKVIDVIIYGKMNGHLEMKDGEIQLDYNFYSLKPFTIYNRTAYLFFCNIIDGLIRHIIVSFNSLLNRF